VFTSNPVRTKLIGCLRRTPSQQAIAMYVTRNVTLKDKSYVSIQSLNISVAILKHFFFVKSDKYFLQVTYYDTKYSHWPGPRTKPFTESFVVQTATNAVTIAS
jgi:hypothetical protein